MVSHTTNVDEASNLFAFDKIKEDPDMPPTFADLSPGQRTKIIMHMKQMASQKPVHASISAFSITPEDGTSMILARYGEHVKGLTLSGKSIPKFINGLPVFDDTADTEEARW